MVATYLSKISKVNYLDHGVGRVVFKVDDKVVKVPYTVHGLIQNCLEVERSSHDFRNEFNRTDIDKFSGVVVADALSDISKHPAMGSDKVGVRRYYDFGAPALFAIASGTMSQSVKRDFDIDDFLAYYKKHPLRPWLYYLAKEGLLNEDN